MAAYSGRLTVAPRAVLIEGRPITECERQSTKALLLEPITKHIVTKRLVNRGPIWECELRPFDFSPAADTSVAPNDRVLITLPGRVPERRTLAGGSLAERVPKITVRVAVSA